MSAEPNVLLVEDDPQILALERRLLERLGCRVAEAADGDLAMELLGQQQFDLVCLDLMLPRTAGLEVCDFARTRWGAGGPRILVVSARHLPLDRAQAAEAGADDYLGKPFTSREFEARVRALLDAPRSNP